MPCPYCNQEKVSSYRGNDGEYLCAECARREILGLFYDIDYEDIEYVKTLRRRIEDTIRKNPKALEEVAVLLLIKGFIKL